MSNIPLQCICPKTLQMFQSIHALQIYIFLIFKYNCISLFLAVLDLHSCADFSVVAVGGAYCYCEAWALGHINSGAVAHGLHPSMAHGIFPDQGSNLCLLLWQADLLPLNHQGSP